MEMRRGDTLPLKFQRISRDTGEPILIKADKVYFTVKRSADDAEFLFQKTIDDMIFDENGFYHFTIEPDDTNGLPFDTEYEYDVEVIVGDYKQTISDPKDRLKLLREVTRQSNER